jgi:PEP-CTERM motif
MNNQMKTTLKRLLAGIMVAFCCSIGNAQLIYSNNFSLGAASDINETSPTYVNPNAPLFGGRSGALWDVVRDEPPPTENYYAYQNGTLGSRQETVLLPFTPVSGYIYTLTASLTFTAVPPGGGWGGLGFAANLPDSSSSAGDPRFNQSLIAGQPWALLNYGAQGGGAELFRNTSAVVGSHANLMSALDTPYTINLVLDTMGPDWSTALYVAGTLVTNYTWTAGNPTITSFGYGQTATTAGAYQWNYLSLSAVPEPSVLALTGLGLAGLCTFLRRRR